MSLTKRYLKSRPVCKVTFKLPKEAAESAQSAAVVGEFNGWSAANHPMKKLRNGGFTATIELDQGQAYQFRYLLDGRIWQNEVDADGSAPTIFRSENSVIRL